MNGSAKIVKQSQRKPAANRAIGDKIQERRERGFTLRNQLFNVIREIEREFDLPRCEIKTK